MTPAIINSSEIRRKSTNPDSTFIWSTFGLLVLSAAMSAQLILSSAKPPPHVPKDFTTFFVHHMTMTRIVLGATTILLAPFLLSLALRLCRIKPIRAPRRVALVAMIPPALAYVSTWLPPAALPVTPIMPAILAWILLQRGLNLTPSRTTIAWSAQMVALTGVLLLGFWVLESVQVGEPLRPLTEIQAIRSHAETTTRDGQPIKLLDDQRSVTFIWSPSGSSWLDHRGNLAQIEFQSAAPGPRRIELIPTTHGEVIAQADLREEAWRSQVFRPQLGMIYLLRITEGFSIGDSLSLHSPVAARISPRDANPEAATPNPTE